MKKIILSLLIIGSFMVLPAFAASSCCPQADCCKEKADCCK